MKTIQAAIDKAQDGDLVSVASGRYSASTNGESFPVFTNKALVLSGDASAHPIIDAAGAGTTVLLASGSIGVFVSNFTIQGGNTGIAYVGPNLSSPIWVEIYNNSVTGNRVQGIDAAFSTVVIKRNLIALNGSAGVVDAGVHTYVSNPTIVNNVIAGNNGHGIYNEVSSSTITNNTFFFNYAGTGIANLSASNPQITNNIVTSNGHYGIFASADSAPTNTYNDVWGNSWGDYYAASGGTGSISKDPKYVSIVDFRLQCGSPAIDAGNNSAPSVPSYDFDGYPRPVDGIVDMGAYEKQPPICAIYLPLIVK